MVTWVWPQNEPSPHLGLCKSAQLYSIKNTRLQPDTLTDVPAQARVAESHLLGVTELDL